jgi:hypothetical protein
MKKGLICQKWQKPSDYFAEGIHYPPEQLARGSGYLQAGCPSTEKEAPEEPRFIF